MVSSFGIHTYLAKNWLFIMNTPYNKDFQIDFNQIVSEIAANWWTDTWNQIIDVQKAYKYHKKIITLAGYWTQITCMKGRGQDHYTMEWFC